MFYIYKKFLQVKTKPFCELVVVLRLYEAFMLETKSFYDLTSLLRF